VIEPAQVAEAAGRRQGSAGVLEIEEDRLLPVHEEVARMQVPVDEARSVKAGHRAPHGAERYPPRGGAQPHRLAQRLPGAEGHHDQSITVLEPAEGERLGDRHALGAKGEEIPPLAARRALSEPALEPLASPVSAAPEAELLHEQGGAGLRVHAQDAAAGVVAQLPGAAARLPYVRELAGHLTTEIGVPRLPLHLHEATRA
jgi:hypothetical protein